MKKQLQVYLFQIFLVDGVEGVIIGAVYVEDGDDLAVPADRDDNLAFRGGGTGDMPRELMHVGHDECLVLRPSRAANAFVIWDAGASNRTLEGT